MHITRNALEQWRSLSLSLFTHGQQQHQQHGLPGLSNLGFDIRRKENILWC